MVRLESTRNVIWGKIVNKLLHRVRPCARNRVRGAVSSQIGDQTWKIEGAVLDQLRKKLETLQRIKRNDLGI